MYEAELLSTVNKEQLKENFVAYQYGKGSKMVPTLIPKSCTAGLDILANLKNRNDMEIPRSNKFLFTSGKSAHHSSGWHAVHEVAEEAGVAHVNATKNTQLINC